MPTIWRIAENETLTAPGASVHIFHDFYPEGHQGGIELVLHGERLVTNGDLRLDLAPGQWDALPEAGTRRVDHSTGEVVIPLAFKQAGLEYELHLCGDGEAVLIRLDLARPLPLNLPDNVGFNLELYPGLLFGKSYLLDQDGGVFPRQGNGPITSGTEGQSLPQPLGRGRKLVIAPEEPALHLEIERLDGELLLLDGRDMTCNGWFVVHAPVQPGASHGAVQLRLLPRRIPGWTRPPVILFSQVGYHTRGEKRILVELDSSGPRPTGMRLERLDSSGKFQPAAWLDLIEIQRFLRYDYGVYDFSEVQTPGLYRLVLEGSAAAITPVFPITADVYEHNVWQPTLETHLPVQMCHVTVLDGGRIWHNACHLDDALQAPLNTTHFDSYRQGGETETPYAPLEHLPFLDRGGWHDAGDFDLAAGSQASTTWTLALAYEEFGLASDQTTVLDDERLVILHRPDGVPDIVQQVAHGVENLLSGYRVFRAHGETGHSFIGIIEDTLEHYTLMGDTASMTDNRIYDPGLGKLEVRAERSGKADDRWVFTQRNTSLEYRVIAALAAASRVLAGWKPGLAEECRQTALAAWEAEQSRAPAIEPNCYVPGRPEAQEILAAVELYLTTSEARFIHLLREKSNVIQVNFAQVGWAVARILPALEDGKFSEQFRQALLGFKSELEQDLQQNPFGVPFHPHVWGVGWSVQMHGFRQYFLHRYFPDLFPSETVQRALNYILGCHPASNTSLVSGVGAQSLTVAYGTNRAEWSYIPGGVASGPNLVRPDFPELKEPFPFIWQQAEYVIGGAASHIFLTLAVQRLLGD